MYFFYWDCVPSGAWEPCGGCDPCAGCDLCGGCDPCGGLEPCGGCCAWGEFCDAGGCRSPWDKLADCTISTTADKVSNKNNNLFISVYFCSKYKGTFKIYLNAY